MGQEQSNNSNIINSPTSSTSSGGVTNSLSFLAKKRNKNFKLKIDKG